MFPNEGSRKILDNADDFVTQGTHKVPDTGKPNTIYEKVDTNGNVTNRGFYDSDGRIFSRQDFAGKPYYDKTTGQYLIPHEHNYSYNIYGNYRNKIESTIPLPGGYNNIPTIY